MRRISYVIVALGISSFFSIFSGKLGDFVFLSAIVSVSLTVFRSKYLNSLATAPLFIIPCFFMPLQSSSPLPLGYLSYMLLESFENRLYLTPERKLNFSLKAHELRMDLGFFTIFLLALFI